MIYVTFPGMEDEHMTTQGAGPLSEDAKRINKWGKSVRPFATYSEEQKSDLLDYTREVIDAVEQASGLDCFIAYGSLLGAVRDGGFIPHDDDIDLAINYGQSNRVTVAAQARKIMEHLLDGGYEVNAQAYGQFKVAKRVDGKRFVVELFAAWSEGDQFFLYFAVPGAPISASIEPLAEIDFLGRSFRVPRVPEDLLAATYGEGWRVPDPDFSYDLGPDSWGPFKFLWLRRNVQHWNQYYLRKRRNEVWAWRRSRFAAFIARELLPEPASILEVGCGNGRDGIFFAQEGHDVLAVDYAEPAITCAANRAEEVGAQLRTGQLNVYNVTEMHAFGQDHHEQFDLVYARFFVHAISEVGEAALLETARRVLKPGGKLALEFRTAGDDRSRAGEDIGYGERIDGHYRRFIETDAFLERCKAVGYSIDYSVVGRGFAKFRDEDPEVCRVVLTR